MDFKAFEASGWDDRAATYERLIGAVTARFAAPLLDAAAVAPGTRTLDAACGTGALSAAAAARGADTVGMDFAAEMVAAARERHPELRFVEGDVEQLPFADASFEAAVAGFVLHHLPDAARGVAEIARVLVPGGRLAATVWDRPERMRLIGLADDAMADACADPSLGVPEGPPGFGFTAPEELAALLEAGGFASVEVRTVAFEHRVAGAQELWDGLLGGTVRTTGQLRAQPPEVRERVRQALARLADAHRAADGALAIPVSALLVSGRRSMLPRRGA